MPELPVTLHDPRSLALAVVVGLIALGLLVAQELVGRSRGDSDPLVDPRRRARRRSASLLMLVTSVTLAAGALTGPRVGGRPNVGYLLVWLLVLAEVCGLLLFAWFDLAATRRIGRELREALHRENLDRIEEEIRRHREGRTAEPEGRNGHAH